MTATVETAPQDGLWEVDRFTMTYQGRSEALVLVARTSVLVALEWWLIVQGVQRA